MTARAEVIEICGGRYAIGFDCRESRYELSNSDRVQKTEKAASQICLYL